MNRLRHVVILTVLATVLPEPATAAGAGFQRPAAVTCASGPAFPQQRTGGNPPDPQYAAERAIDGRPETFCCLLDDTLTGQLATTIPAKAAEPVTGHLVFDLGEVRLVTALRLTSRKDSGGAMNPKQVDFFYYADDDPRRHRLADDLENDPDIRPLLKGHTFARLGGGASEDVTWDGVAARYIGIRVNSSYESGGVHHNFQIGEIEFCGGAVPAGTAPGTRVPPLYVKRDTLAETLLATRQQYAKWFPAAGAEDADQRPQAATAARLWEQVRNDFPPAEHRLLEYVHFDWFEGDGWLARSGDTALEQEAVGRALAGAGAGCEHLRKELEELAGARTPPQDPRWLGLCQRAAELAIWVRKVDALRLAVEELGRSYPARYRSKEYLDQLDDLRRQVVARSTGRPDTGEADLRRIARQLETLTHRALVLDNPLLAGGKLLLVKRFTYRTGWYYSEFMQASRFGGNLCVLTLADGTVRELVPELAGGIFDRYDLSFDGRRVVFGYKPAAGRGFRIHEVGVDGRGLRQLTADPPGEGDRLAAYGRGEGDLGPYRHHTDDFHPCYLPDGGICFASSRCERGVLCDQGDRLSVNTLFRMDADGKNLRALSQGALSESTPSVTGDGRILYTRWEYVDKGVIASQPLWAMHPDGSGTTEVYGGGIESPPVLIHGRAIPRRHDLFVATATMHHPFAVGPIVLIDTSKNIRTHAPLRPLTPDTGLCIEGIGGFPRGENFTHLANGRWVKDNVGPLFCDPYPLSDKFFLVTCNADRPWNAPTAYGLWLIDVFGNRVRIYDDAEISCWQPIPLGPRLRPAVLPSRETEGDSAAASEQGDDAKPGEAAEATVLLADVTRGLEGVPRGTIKYLRVLEQVARPWSAHSFWPGDAALGQNAPISMNAHVYVKVLHGVVPVREDGSAHFRVPASRNLFFQVLDEDYMEVQRMRTFVNLLPGETRSCVGCHPPRELAPGGGEILALRDPPQLPGPQPGETGPRPIHYPTDVQPIWDKHCLPCHNMKRRDGDLDLGGQLTTYFNRSYEQLMQKKLVACIQEFVGPQPRAQKTNVTQLPPRALGSHASRLIQVLREGHEEVGLSSEEWIRLVTWVDANAPYYGSYFGRRNLIHREHADFRPVPTLESAEGIRPR